MKLCSDIGYSRGCWPVIEVVRRSHLRHRIERHAEVGEGST
jgi:hypothetical protein